MPSESCPPPPYLRRPRAADVAVSYTARQVAVAYGAPLDQLDGSGVTVGLIELGGAVNPADLTAAGLPDRVTVIAVDGADPVSDGPDGADGEVMLDVEVAAGVAPGADLRVYFAPNTDAGFLHACREACADCDVVSISWGGPESAWTQKTVRSFAEVFAAARAAGVTVFAAAGDSGSRDGTRTDTVDYPASDPNVIGCGGTRLTLTPNGERAGEVVWNDDPTRSATGGGVSRLFPGRTVPDVAGNADPVTGYRVTVDGQPAVIGGTSAVAPLYAGCHALMLQATGARYDFLNTVTVHPGLCFDITQGSNGGFRAGPGRDDVSGLGVVDFDQLLDVLTGPVPPPSTGGVPPPPAGGDPDWRTVLQDVETVLAAELAKIKTALGIG